MGPASRLAALHLYSATVAALACAVANTQVGDGWYDLLAQQLMAGTFLCVQLHSTTSCIALPCIAHTHVTATQRVCTAQVCVSGAAVVNHQAPYLSRCTVSRHRLCLLCRSRLFVYFVKYYLMNVALLVLALGLQANYGLQQWHLLFVVATSNAIVSEKVSIARSSSDG